MEIRYNEQSVESYRKYNLTVVSRAWKEYEKLREIIIQTIGKRVAKGIAYDEKVDWNTQKCIKFFKYDNDKDTFVEV